MALLGLFEPLDLQHQGLLDRFLSEHPPEISELTFVNLWAWLMCHPVYIHLEGETLFIIRKAGDHYYGLMPLGGASIAQKVRRLSELMAEFQMDFRMERVTFTDSEILKGLGYTVREDRDQWDYVYARQALSELPGRDYHRKRNHIKNCLKEFRCEYRPFTADLIPACKGFLDEWCRIRHCADNEDLFCEQRAIRILLHDYVRFRILGGTVFVNGELSAVTFAERLNADTAVIHFEKAHPEINGLYPLINQWFCRNALEGFTWVNREQDLGVPGLRKAKESYYPAKLVKKYRVSAPS